VAAIQHVCEAVEKAKIELTSAAQTKINLPFIIAADMTGNVSPKHRPK
jgi:molecular chaperone DnaK (HSP70)